jgi:argininosuccinate lyase
MAFSPDYVRLVLAENFEDAKALFLTPLLAIHRAHLVMLAEEGLVSKDVAKALREAIDAIDVDDVRRAVFDGSCEDLFFYVNRLLVERAGSERAGRLHTARSRNDIDMTLYRMRLRAAVLDLAGEVVELRRVLLRLASEHLDTVFAAHTHTQPAQPTTVAHYLLAVVEQLERDSDRLLAAFRTVNRCPLGACAITGTGFPINRARTSELLGFDGHTGNTYGSIATVDYLLEAAGAASTALIGIGRVVQDLLLWSTVEVGYLRLTDEFVQTSSIMPQKRNPVAIEHARSIASRAVGELAAIPAALHNTPFGDIVDTEDDLQPLVAAAFHDAIRATQLVRVTLADARFDRDRMRQSAESGWVAITELADVLVRREGWSFHQAHALAAAVAQAPRPTESELVPALLRQKARDAGFTLTVDDQTLAGAFDPFAFVEVRRTIGGPSPAVVTAAIEQSRTALDESAALVDGRRQGLLFANDKLGQAFAAL